MCLRTRLNLDLIVKLSIISILMTLIADFFLSLCVQLCLSCFKCEIQLEV